MAADLKVLVNNLPTAQAGALITENYHNALRAFLVEMINQLGSSLGQPVPTAFGFAPALFLNFSLGVPNWSSNPGTAFKQPGVAKVSGWMPIALPDQSKVQSMQVSGTNATLPVQFFSVVLRRCHVGNLDSAAEDLINMALQDAGTLFSVTQTVGVGEKFTVDNTKYRYFIIADAQNKAGVDAQCDLRHVEIVCLK